MCGRRAYARARLQMNSRSLNTPGWRHSNCYYYYYYSQSRNVFIVLLAFASDEQDKTAHVHSLTLGRLFIYFSKFTIWLSSQLVQSPMACRMQRSLSSQLSAEHKRRCVCVGRWCRWVDSLFHRLQFIINWMHFSWTWKSLSSCCHISAPFSIAADDVHRCIRGGTSRRMYAEILSFEFT